MENSFQTSFIPKKTDILNSSRKESRSPFFLISIFILIVSILVSGGMFFYKSYLNKQKLAVSSSLSAIRGDFDKDTIDELTLFDKKIEISKKLLADHIIVSSFFDRLALITIPSIQYTSFDYTSNEGKFSIKLNGVASDYKAIIHQSDFFSSEKGQSFTNVVFSGLSKNKDNNSVAFSLDFNVDPREFSYKNNDSDNEINPQ